MSAITPLTLSGVSQYSTDYQNILNRAVQIASIPVQQLQSRDSNLLQQKSLLGTLDTSAGSLLTSLQNLGTLGANQAVSASSSDSTVVTATATGATTPATFTVDSVTAVASTASERSLQGFADSAATPVSATGVLRLNVGTKNYALTPKTNNLTSLRDAINASGAPVTASILTTANGNYLSVTANASGQNTLQLIDDPITAKNPSGANTELLTQANQGGNAEFSLSGIDIKQSSNTVNAVIPGITLQLVKQSTTPVTISLESDTSQLASGLQNFVTQYNALGQQLQGQVGQNAGLLTGDPAVTELQQTLRQITSFNGATGSVTNLGALGISFDSTGKASFDPTVVDALSPTQVSDGFKFLSALSAGAGNFTAQLQNFADPIAGLIQTEENGITATDKNLQSQITTLTDRINLLQSNLQLQLAKADAQEAALQSQQQGISASLVGLNFVLFGAPNTAA